MKEVQSTKETGSENLQFFKEEFERNLKLEHTDNNGSKLPPLTPIDAFIQALVTIISGSEEKEPIFPLIMKNKTDRVLLQKFIDKKITDKPALLEELFRCILWNKDEKAQYEAGAKFLKYFMTHNNLDLSEDMRSGLIAQMIKTNKSGYFDVDFTQFLIEKGLQIPKVDLIVETLLDKSGSRFKGFSATLIVAFFDQKNGPEFAINVIERIKKEIDKIKESKKRDRGLLEVKKTLEEELKIIASGELVPNELLSEYLRHIATYAIKHNDDDILSKAIPNRQYANRAKGAKARNYRVTFEEIDQAHFLIQAAQHGHTKTFQILINGGFSPFAKDEEGKTFLHHGQSHSPEFLRQYIRTIENKYKHEQLRASNLRNLVNTTDDVCRTALDVAIEEVRYLKSVTLLLQIGAIAHQRHLLKAIENQDARILRYLLQQPEIEELNLDEVVEHIIEKQDSVLANAFLKFIETDPKNKKKYSARLSNIPIREDLIGLTQLFYICEYLGSSYLEACLGLLNKAEILKEVNIADGYGDTPLTLAIGKGRCYEEVVKILLNNGANPNTPYISEDGEQYPTDLAIKGGHPAVLGLLIKHSKIEISVVQKAAKLLTEPQNLNATLIKAFLLNVRPEHFQQLNPQHLQNLYSLTKYHKFEKSLQRFKDMSKSMEDLDLEHLENIYQTQKSLLERRFSRVEVNPPEPSQKAESENGREPKEGSAHENEKGGGFAYRGVYIGPRPTNAPRSATQTIGVIKVQSGRNPQEPKKAGSCTIS
ncbi:MAG: hypothetical protein O3B09_04410 [Proteobacteria bacterium]|nr:hypothetical protein [Pseudomonadota bacterium]